MNFTRRDIIKLTTTQTLNIVVKTERTCWTMPEYEPDAPERIYGDKLEIPVPNI